MHDYEDIEFEVKEKESKEAVVYVEEELLDDSLKDIAASELVNCINSSIDVDKLANKLRSQVTDSDEIYISVHKNNIDIAVHKDEIDV